MTGRASRCRRILFPQKQVSDETMKNHHYLSIGWSSAFLLLGSTIFFEALHAPTIDDSVIPNLDKIVHALVFGLLAFLLLRSLRAFDFARDWRVLLGVGLIVTIIGVLDEWMQSMVPGRTASLMDVLADGLGVASVLLTVAMLKKC